MSSAIATASNNLFLIFFTISNSPKNTFFSKVINYKFEKFIEHKNVNIVTSISLALLT